MAPISSNQLTTEIKVPSYLKFSKVIVWLLYFWVLIGVVSLFFRVFLLAFSANPGAGFTNFIFKISYDYLNPFRGIFPPKELTETGYLDTAALFAIIVYLFLAWGIKSLIDYVQNKIDITTAEQKEQIAKIEKQQAAGR